MNARGHSLDATLGQFIDVGDALPFELFIFVSHYTLSSGRIVEHVLPARREQLVPQIYQIFMGILFLKQSAVKQDRTAESFALPYRAVR
jgi:hypothetical protein